MSRGIVKLALAAAVASSFGAAAAADEAGPGYSVDDVVAHFAPAVPGLGKPRALCVGPASECGAPGAIAEPATPFNLEVNFQLGSADLTPTAREQLDVFAEAATSALTDQRFMIDGHTDAHGSDELNLSLSKERAASVVNYLVAQGVDEARLVSAGHGEAKPKHDDPYNGGNRRVEASLID